MSTTGRLQDVLEDILRRQDMGYGRYRVGPLTDMDFEEWIALKDRLVDAVEALVFEENQRLKDALMTVGRIVTAPPIASWSGPGNMAATLAQHEAWLEQQPTPSGWTYCDRCGGQIKQTNDVWLDRAGGSECWLAPTKLHIPVEEPT